MRYAGITGMQKNKSEQVQILAELNAIDRGKVIDILTAAGEKVRIPIVVAPNNAQAVFFVILTKASGLGIPRFISTIIPSVITMALSTSIPIATINDARDTLCKVPCIICKITKEPKTTTTNPIPII